MPKKYKSKLKKKFLSQKKYIAKRLMGISIQVDKYIYKDKPIPKEQAQMYLQEVISFKPLCINDAHSLQVIEKLTRYIKAIIEEQEANASGIPESENLFLASQNTENYVASPVYSLPDEDRTQMLECMDNDIIMNNDYVNDSNDITVNGPSILSNTVSSTVINQPNDICYNASRSTNEVINTDNATASNIDHIPESDVDKELTNVIIDLTLDDQDNLTCSQSIFNINDTDVRRILFDKNLDHTYQQNTSEKNKDYNKITQEENTINCNTNHNFISNAYGQDMSEVDKEINNIIQDEQRFVNSKIVHKTQLQINNPVVAERPTAVSELNQSFKIQKVFAEISSNDNNRTNKRKPKNVKIKDNNKKKIFKEDKNKKENKTKRGKKTQLLTNSDFTATNTEKKSNTIISKANDPKIIPILQSSNKNFNAAPPKMTKKYVDDLSWVENIRYVRVIETAEYDPGLNSLPDSFWENCLLPENWDDRDFD